MKNILPVNDPIISFVPQNNYIFSILGEGHPLFYEYIFSNYIQIAFDYNYSWAALRTRFYDDYFYNYMKNQCLQCVTVTKEMFPVIGESPIGMITSLIDLSYYISININVNCIKEYDNKKHMSHELMIYGYDSDTNEFFIRDFFSGVYRSGKCSFDELIDGIENYHLTNEQFMYDGFLAIKSRENYTPKINLIEFANQLHALVNSEYSMRDISFGLSWFDAIIYLLNNDKEHLFVLSLTNSIHFIQQHIILMRKRTIYLYDNSILDYRFTTQLNGLESYVAQTKNKCMKIYVKGGYEEMLPFNDTQKEFFIGAFIKIRDDYRGILGELIQDLSLYNKSDFGFKNTQGRTL